MLELLALLLQEATNSVHLDGTARAQGTHGLDATRSVAERGAQRSLVEFCHFVIGEGLAQRFGVQNGFHMLKYRLVRKEKLRT